MPVSLAEPTKEGREECAGLDVREVQRHSVDSDLYCIPESRFEAG